MRGQHGCICPEWGLSIMREAPRRPDALCKFEIFCTGFLLERCGAPRAEDARESRISRINLVRDRLYEYRTVLRPLPYS